jgi:proteasome activator subunit 4
MYMNLDTITEPHKLTVSMMCVVAAARPMLEVRNGPAAGPEDCQYLAGTSHVLPLLMSILPGIDPNDSLKCFVTFQFISTFASMVPLVDCSRASEYWKDLTEVSFKYIIDIYYIIKNKCVYREKQLM